MPILRHLIAAAAVALLPASAAMAELNLRVAFTEKQTRSGGIGGKRSTCTTEYVIKTLGPLLFLETAKSNCKTFRVGDLQGADGSASALVFEGRNSHSVKTCTYSAKSRTERCNDGTKLRVPDGPKVDYKSRIDARSSYALKKTSLTLSRKMARDLTTSKGSKQRTDAALEMRIVIQGKNCEVSTFKSTAQSKVTAGPGKGSRLKESRQLVRSESCRVLSR